MMEREEGMDEEQRIAFRAETMRLFKESDAYQILRGIILGLIHENSRKLLDRKVSKEEKIHALLGELRAYNDILVAIDTPQAKKRDWDKYMEYINKAQEEAAAEEDLSYYGAGGVA